MVLFTPAPGNLKERITLDFPSVGATENLMMAAALAHGVTYIENAAEPEIINLADVLRLMGIPIKGDGTQTIRITGKPEAGTAEAEIIPDRIEAATYLIAGIITKGAVTVRGIDSGLIDAILLKLEEAGATIEIMLDEVTAKSWFFDGNPRQDHAISGFSNRHSAPADGCTLSCFRNECYP